MELESETGKLVETYEKYLNDDIHELTACRITKDTVNKTVRTIFAVRLKDLSKFHEFETASPASFRSSYVHKWCVLHMILQGAEGGHDISPNYQ